MMPAIVENCRSIGAATEAAMVSGLAPGNVAVTWMVGKSTARQRRDRQQPVGEDAENDERRRDQRRHHRPADAELRKCPCQDPGASALRGRDPRPLVSSSWPSVTTRRRPRGRFRSPSRRRRSRATLTGCTLRDAVLDDEDEGAGLADLHRRSPAPSPPPPAQRQRTCYQRAGPQQLVLVRHGGAHRSPCRSPDRPCSRSS